LLGYFRLAMIEKKRILSENDVTETREKALRHQARKKRIVLPIKGD
jgi:hypothetical protein